MPTRDIVKLRHHGEVGRVLRELGLDNTALDAFEAGVSEQALCWLRLGEKHLRSVRRLS